MISNKLKKALKEVLDYYILKLQILGYEPITKEMGDTYYGNSPSMADVWVNEFKTGFYIKRVAGHFYLFNYDPVDNMTKSSMGKLENFDVKKIVHKPNFNETELFHEKDKVIAGIELKKVTVNIACITSRKDADIIGYFPKKIKDYVSSSVANKFDQLYNFSKL